MYTSTVFKPLKTPDPVFGQRRNKKEEGDVRRGIFARTVPAVVRKAKGKWKRRKNFKNAASEMWKALGNPVFDSPLDLESHYPAAVVAIAKRGRQCALGTMIVGINRTIRDLRDFERSDLEHGHDAEAERLG